LALRDNREELLRICLLAFFIRIVIHPNCAGLAQRGADGCETSSTLSFRQSSRARRTPQISVVAAQILDADFIALARGGMRA
jgi:hypothetical protein